MRCYCNTDLGRSSTFLSAAVTLVDDQGAIAPDPHIDSGCQVVEQPLPFSLWASWRPLWLGRTPSADRSCRADVKRLLQASSLRSSGSEEGREGRSGRHCGRNAEVGQLASAPSSDSAEARSLQLPFGGNPCRQGWSYGKCRTNHNSSTGVADNQSGAHEDRKYPNRRLCIGARDTSTNSAVERDEICLGR